MNQPAYPAVTSQPNLPEIERAVLERWEREQTFRASVDRRPAGEHGDNEFVFYDGPPFANGLPHYGHLLTGYVKDAVPRYQTMRGRRVERRFGWDCHGLPAEVQAEKELGIAGHPEIAAFGIDKFNDACRTSVLRYTQEWQDYVTRQARWVDFEHDYKTLDIDYMESVMWAFKSLWDKDLINEGFRVLAYCWRCETPLSNTETRMDDVYRDRQDPALTVRFRLDEGLPGAETCRPRCWPGRRRPGRCRRTSRSPSDPTSTYAVMEEDGERFMLAESRLGAYERELAGAERVGTIVGSELVGCTYAPMFAVLRRMRQRASRCCPADFVSTEDGTGIVHMAPGFGEDDQIACNAVGIPTICPMDEHGRYTAEVTEYVGQHVFDANTPIIRRLKDEGVVVRHDSYDHSYPHCWRCAQPLVYRAIVVVVREGHRLPRPHGRTEPADHLGARTRQGRQLRQVARERPRLGDQSQPVLGLADPGVEERRPDLPARRRVRLDRGAAARLRRPRSPICTGPAIDDLVRPNPDDPDRRLDDASGAGGARLLVRVRVDAVRAGALPVRERRLVRAPLPG